MLTNGLFRCPVRVLAVLAADRYSVALLDHLGRRTRDDVTLLLADFKTPTISRPMDPPLRALGMYDAEAAAGRGPSNGPAACPLARDAAERLVRRPRVHLEIVVPVSGPHWLRSLASGVATPGDLRIGTADATPGGLVSIAEHLYPAHLLRREGTV